MQNQAAKDDPIAARKAMLDRVVSDFTFKANQTDDQKTLWNSIDQHFSIFHINERIRLCESVNKYCFDLVTRLTQILPQGRAMSVAVTAMQEVRGWLLDAINFNMPKTVGN